MAQRGSLTTHAATVIHNVQSAARPLRDLLSLRLLQRILGAIWLVDGLFQLQPPIFTHTLITAFMQPLTQRQPGCDAAVPQLVITLTPQHLVLDNAALALVQTVLGLWRITGWLVRPALLATPAWSLAVWIWGEGLGLLLTGQASALTGAPGAMVLYGILGLAAYPTVAAGSAGLLSRRHLQWVLAGFWAMAAVLQLQPVWWQPGQIAQAIAGNEAVGTLSGALLDPSLDWV